MTSDQSAQPTSEESADDPLLAVRFAVPSPPQVYVERPRLMRRLDQGAEAPLTLVSAPAGSGKTALVAAWAAQRRAAGHSTAWVTFEEHDVPSTVFWPHVREALRRLDVDAPYGRYDTPEARAEMLSRLAGVLDRRTTPLTLVLDGYEIATAEESGDVDFLLRHSGRHLHVMILTRVDPVLPLHRYRLADMVVELRMADLALDEQETSRLVQLTGIELSDSSIAALARRTRGWAAGLRFACMTLDRSDDPEGAVAQLAGDTGNIAEYLMAEMLQRQPSDVRSLLLRTSVVDVLQPGLAEELAGRSASRKLAALAGRNVLVEPLADRPGWYRYHPFLRDLLRAELALESPTRRRRLHRKAGAWYARRGFLASAVSAAATVGAWADASAYVVDELAIGEVLLGHDASGLTHELRKMPATVRDPAAAVVRAALALADQDMERCAVELEGSGGPDAPESEHDRAVQASANVVRSVRSSLLGDPHTITLADQAQLALTSLEREKRVRRPALTGLVQAGKGRALLQDGELAEARIALTTAAGTQARGFDAMTVSCLGYLALIDSHQGELRRADDLASQSAAQAERAGLLLDGPPGAAEVARTWVEIERCDLRAGSERLKEALRSHAVSDEPLLQALSAVAQARILRARGELDEAALLLEGVSHDAPGTAGWPQLLLQTEAATLRIVVGEPDVALRMMEQLGAPAGAVSSLVVCRAHLERADWPGVEESLSTILVEGATLRTIVGGSLIEAALLLHRGQSGPAKVSLKRALRLAAPEGLRMPFRESSTAVLQFLQTDAELADRSIWLGSVVGARRKVLPLPRTRPARSGDGAEVEPFIEPLTAKETEVLGHLSELLSTEEIAAVMFVSVNTVRTHIRSILRKLAVSRRNEAVRRARALSLIPV